jgi:Rrf2 family protein
MAGDQEDKFHLAQDLAKQLDIPAPFLAKILQLLVKKNLLHSSKGRSGGFSFARPPAKIKLIEVVEAIDGIALTEGCVMGLPTCGERNPCPVHPSWGKIRQSIVHMLKMKTIKGVAADRKT